MELIIVKLIKLLRKLITLLEDKLKIKENSNLEYKLKSKGNSGARVDWSISQDKALKPNENIILLSLLIKLIKDAIV